MLDEDGMLSNEMKMLADQLFLFNQHSDAQIDFYDALGTISTNI